MLSTKWFGILPKPIRLNVINIDGAASGSLGPNVFGGMFRNSSVVTLNYFAVNLRITIAMDVELIGVIIAIKTIQELVRLYMDCILFSIDKFDF